MGKVFVAVVESILLLPLWLLLLLLLLLELGVVVAVGCCCCCCCYCSTGLRSRWKKVCRLSHPYNVLSVLVPLRCGGSEKEEGGKKKGSKMGSTDEQRRRLTFFSFSAPSEKKVCRRESRMRRVEKGKKKKKEREKYSFGAFHVKEYVLVLFVKKMLSHFSLDSIRFKLFSKNYRFHSQGKRKREWRESLCFVLLVIMFYFWLLFVLRLYAFPFSLTLGSLISSRAREEGGRHTLLSPWERKRKGGRESLLYDSKYRLNKNNVENLSYLIKLFFVSLQFLQWNYDKKWCDNLVVSKLVKRKRVWNKMFFLV